MVSKFPGPFLEDTAPNANRKGAGYKNVFGGVRRGAWGEATAAWAGASGRSLGSGPWADGEPPHMELVDALSGAEREGRRVCAGEDSGNG